MQAIRDARAAINSTRSRFRHRLGYRGIILLMFGLIYISIGLAVIGANDYHPALVHTHLPITFRVCLWGVPGLAALAVAADHKWQAIGFGLLFIPPSERAISYLIAAVTTESWTRVPSFLVYTLILITVTLVASWPEPTEVQKDIQDQDPGSLGHDDSGKYLDGTGVVRDHNDDDRPVSEQIEDLLHRHSREREGGGHR